MAQKKKKTKAVAKKGKGDVVVAGYEEFEGQGFENQTRDDVAIPFLSVLTFNSPQVKDPEQGGLEGAKTGMLFNTVTEELYDGKTGVYFVPAVTQHTFVEWVPRDDGGGFVAMFDPTDPVVEAAKAASEEFGKYSTEAGNDLVETFYIYGALVGESPEDQMGMAVVAFTSTKIKVYKRLNTKLAMFTVAGEGGRKFRPPMFAHRLVIKSKFEKNNKGEFYNFVIEPANGNVKDSLLAPDDPRFQFAVEAKGLVDSGIAKADFSSQKAAGEGGETDGEKPPF